MSDGTLTPHRVRRHGRVRRRASRRAAGSQPRDPVLRFGRRGNTGPLRHWTRSRGWDPELPGHLRSQLPGGNTTIRFNRRAFHRTGGNIEDFVCNVGSVVNCAGGVHPGLNAWFTCEEIVQEPGNPTGSLEAQTQPHGYVYPVPAGLSLAQSPATPQPVVQMGRFAHEAVAVDPATGIIYETEDAGSARAAGAMVVPNNPSNPYAGGTLSVSVCPIRRVPPVTFVTVSTPKRRSSTSPGSHRRSESAGFERQHGVRERLHGWRLAVQSSRGHLLRGPQHLLRLHQWRRGQER